jgi:hypothetical protein
LVKTLNQEHHRIDTSTKNRWATSQSISARPNWQMRKHRCGLQYQKLRKQTKNRKKKGGDGKYQHSENHPKTCSEKGEKSMYQPEMNEENVRRLYYLKLEKRKPMTKLLDQILNDYFKKHKEGDENSCTNARSAETHSKSNGRETEGITTTSDTDTAPSAASNTTP